MKNKSSEIDYESINEEVRDEINRLRTNPSGYAAKIESHLKFITNSNVYSKPGEDNFKLYENKSAFEEVVRLLKRTNSCSALSSESKLHHAARDHADDIGARHDVT